MTLQLVHQVFRHEGGALAKNIPVQIALRDTNNVVKETQTDGFGMVHIYLEEGTYDWLVMGQRVPLDVYPLLQGPIGPSAYDLARENGFTGTLSEWLASLHGVKGDEGDASVVPGPDGLTAYEIAVQNDFQGTETEWLASLEGADSTNPGPAGPSAYQVAVANGFQGTEAEWLASLKVKGDRGPGLIPASAAERQVISHVIPAASPFEFTIPAGQFHQFSVTGGSGIATVINSGTGGFTTFVGGTGTSPMMCPGETIRITWSTTAPTAIRSRILFKEV